MALISFENQNTEAWFGFLILEGSKGRLIFTHLHTRILNNMGGEIWKNFRSRAGGQVKLRHYNFSPCQTDRRSVAQLPVPRISHQTD